MNIFFVVLQQIVIMLIFAALGFAFFKKGIISIEGNRSMGNILISVAIPSIIIKSYIIPFSTAKFRELAICTLLSVLTMVISTFIAGVFFKRLDLVDEFATVYANVGFFGIPLVQAILGNEAIFYLSTHIAIMNVFQWSYGNYVMSDRRKFPSVKIMLRNPIILAVPLGMLLFFLPFETPAIITEVFELGATVSVPLSMLVVGAYLAQARLRDIFFSKTLYLTSIVSLVLIPATVAIILYFVPTEYTAIKMTLFIATATPIATTVPTIVEMSGQNYSRAVLAVCQSTVLSILSLPVTISLAARILQ